MEGHFLAYTCLDARNKKLPNLHTDLGLNFREFKEYGEHPLVGVTRVCSDYKDEHGCWRAVGHNPTRLLSPEFGWTFSAQISPYKLTLNSLQNRLSVFGLYNDSADLLIVTSIDNLVDLIGTSWWHHRMPVDEFSISVPRLCSRWYRWKRELDLTSAQRFCILERNLKGGSRSM